MTKLFILFFTLLFAFGILAEDTYSKNMIIITTNSIMESSDKLDDYILAKKKRGFDIKVATEDDFGGKDLNGIEKAKLIREWLKKNHEGFSYLLLIGNSNESSGDIPMMKTWPLHMFPETTEGPYPTNDPVDTDMFYADLSGNWDLNGNGKFGETELDSGPGGIDFDPEVIVGRIHVPDDDVDILDAILSNTISYMDQTSEDTDYRKTLLFPAGFYFFRGMVGDDDWDSAGLGEWFIENYLKENKDFSYFTMYEEEGHQASTFHSDLPLNKTNLLTKWKEGVGAVFWGGHTFSGYIMRSVWSEDKNEDDLASMNELSMPHLFDSTDAKKLSSDKPAFLISPNCNAGIVKTSNSMAQKLLQNGSVGIMAATEASTPSMMEWECTDCPWHEESYGSDTAGIFAMKALIENRPPAVGFFESKRDFGNNDYTDSSSKGLAFANKMMFNWYGDPSLTISDTIEDATVEIPDDLSDEESDEKSEIDDTDMTDTETSDEETKKSSDGCSVLIF
jgi:hypothetical protein